MTRKGGRQALKRSGIGEDKRHPKRVRLAPINSRLNVVMPSPTPFWLGQVKRAVGLSEGPSYSGHFPRTDNVVVDVSEKKRTRQLSIPTH